MDRSTKAKLKQSRHQKGTVKVLALDLLRLSTLIIKGTKTASLTPSKFDEQPRLLYMVNSRPPFPHPLSQRGIWNKRDTINE